MCPEFRKELVLFLMYTPDSVCLSDSLREQTEVTQSLRRVQRGRLSARHPTRARAATQQLLLCQYSDILFTASIVVDCSGSTASIVHK